MPSCKVSQSFGLKVECSAGQLVQQLCADCCRRSHFDVQEALGNTCYKLFAQRLVPPAKIG